jgi:thiamine-phosphate pyrophosphorylase
LKSCVPAAVPGIAFLSGGQSDEEATAHLDAMNRIGGLPWKLTFSYGRALQAAPQKAWSGKPRTSPPGKQAFIHRARMNSLPARAAWNADLERPCCCGSSLPTSARMISRIKALAPAIQDKGAALLLDGHVELVARAGADGAHLTGIAAMEDALPTLKPDRIAGVGGLATRHDSMAAGEAGADYVLFGEPDAKGQRPSIEAITERLQWWAELFEPPCVGFAASLDEARRIRRGRRGFRSGRRFHLERSARRRRRHLREAEQAIRRRTPQWPASQSRPGMTPE